MITEFFSQEITQRNFAVPRATITNSREFGRDKLVGLMFFDGPRAKERDVVVGRTTGNEQWVKRVFFVCDIKR